MPESAPVHAPRSTSKRRTPVQKAALVAGAVFLLVGVLGFVPGVTTHYDQLTFAGHHSDAALLGIFNVSILHNLVHLAFGVAGIALSRTFNSARAYLIAGGAVYVALFVYGLVIDKDSSANFIPVNDGDNWLHLGLSVAMIALGAALGRTRDDSGGPGGTDEGTHVTTPNGPAR
ncbi:MAG: hypothetical protein QOF25_564 [Mycobacterium sp.]|jgi:hypothetical protein|nr:hypothetical protein [Mycobacterium sp.]